MGGGFGYDPSLDLDSSKSVIQSIRRQLQDALDRQDYDEAGKLVAELKVEKDRHLATIPTIIEMSKY